MAGMPVYETLAAVFFKTELERYLKLAKKVCMHVHYAVSGHCELKAICGIQIGFNNNWIK